MKVILEISEKALKKAKAITLLKVDLDETIINRAIEEWKHDGVTEIKDSILVHANKERIEIGLAIFAIVQHLKDI